MSPDKSGRHRDPQPDYLTSAKYDDDGNGTWDATHTWTYL